MKNELDKFEHVGQISISCQSGQHLFDEEEGHSTVEKDGDLTKIKLKCLRCKQQFDISADFGLNRYINKQGINQQPLEPIYQPQSTEEEIELRSEILNKILK